MKYLYFFISLLILNTNTFAQEVSSSPYNVKLAVDIPVTVGAAGLAFAGLKYALRGKETLDSAYVATLHPGLVNKIDRSATEYYDTQAGKFSDYTMFTAFLLPLTLLADDDIRANKGKVGLMYLETMAIMGSVYTWGVGSIKRNRPYVYNPDVPFSKKLRIGTTNSFFAGHPAATAASTFFLAKVYNDFHPESAFKYVLWGAAIVPPAAVGYFRYKNGQHFPTDIAVGIPIGILIGVGIPHLHKICKRNDKFSLFPASGGLGLTYKL